MIDIFGKETISSDKIAIDKREYEELIEIKEIMCDIFSTMQFSTALYEIKPYEQIYLSDRHKAMSIRTWVEYLISTYKVKNYETNSLDKTWLLKEICDIRPEHIGFFKSKLDENMTSNNNYFFLYAIHRNGIFKWTIDKNYWDLYNCEILLPKGFLKDTKFITDPKDLF